MKRGGRLRSPFTLTFRDKQRPERCADHFSASASRAMPSDTPDYSPRRAGNLAGKRGSSVEETDHTSPAPHAVALPLMTPMSESAVADRDRIKPASKVRKIH